MMWPYVDLTESGHMSKVVTLPTQFVGEGNSSGLEKSGF